MTALPTLGDIDLLIFDFDGVLTDNRVLVSSNGVESVMCHRGDGWGINLLRKAGLEMVIVSTEANSVVRVRAEKLRLAVTHGVEDKADAVRVLARERNLDLARVAFVGNDTNDLPALKIVGWPMSPGDGHAEVRAIARWISEACGGYGVARELADVLLSKTGPRALGHSA